jgi:hypothetical protein
MPLGEFMDAAGQAVSNFATNADGARNSEFCIFCYKSGAFTTPDLTLDGMIAKSVENMTGELRMPESKARELAKSVIPELRRWSVKA